MADTIGPTSTILLIEDDWDVGVVIQRMLATGGWTVEWVRDPATALATIAVRHRAIDAVLIDLTLGLSDGLDLVPVLAPLLPGAPVLLITGHAPATVARLTLPPAVVGIIYKPVSMIDLNRAVAQAVRHQASGRAAHTQLKPT